MIKSLFIAIIALGGMEIAYGIFTGLDLLRTIVLFFLGLAVFSVFEMMSIERSSEKPASKRGGGK
jgi:hypothetical protein